MRYRKLSENYLNYIRSDEWKMKRQHILYIRHNTCEKCGNRVDYRFHVHHLTYKNLGHEKDEDLMLLCEHCHSNIHGRDLTLILLHQKKYAKKAKKTSKIKKTKKKKGKLKCKLNT